MFEWKVAGTPDAVCVDSVKSFVRGQFALARRLLLRANLFVQLPRYLT